jgi:methyl-accepting chemotaxis protein
MANVTDVRVQKLFALALGLKITSSALGWWLRDPWILGLLVPLLVMIAYIVIGLNRHDSDVTDDKFADSCYYLGFIFTITSIIFSLFDLPNIGTRIQDIAVRFGAAMISTVLGLGVRVYLVSFRKEVADAIRDAEDAVLDATRKFTDQLNLALDRLQDYSKRVDEAARDTSDRVNAHISEISRNHAEKLGEFFSDLTESNKKSFDDALSEVRKASLRLSDSVDQYSNGMRANIDSIGAKVDSFARGVDERLKKTTFPDDYFDKHLQGPLAQLSEAAGSVARESEATARSVKGATTALDRSLRLLGSKASMVDSALDTVPGLVKQQKALFDAAESQLDALRSIPPAIESIGKDFRDTADEVKRASIENSVLGTRVDNVIVEGVNTRDAIERALVGVASKLEENSSHIRSLAEQIASASATANKAVSQLEAVASTGEKASSSIAASSAASEKIAGDLRELVTADIDAARALAGIEGHASNAIQEVRDAAEKLAGIAQRLESLDGALRGQGSELAQVVGRVTDIRIPVQPFTVRAAPGAANSSITASEPFANVEAKPPSQHEVLPTQALPAALDGNSSSAARTDIPTASLTTAESGDPDRVGPDGR